MTMKILLIFALIFHINLIISVDRSNFKTCSQSSFCERQKSFNHADSNCFIVKEAVHISDSSFKAEISCKNRVNLFELHLTKLQNHVFRFRIIEKNPKRPRFEPKIGDSLVKEPIEDHMKIVFDEQKNVYLFKGNNDEKGILHLNPFKLDLYLSDLPLISVNSRNLFNFETTKVKEVIPEEQQNTNDTNNESTEETFKDHIDSRPYGDNSVAIDVSFPGFQYVYGIPEHADRFALRNTNDGEPYRLYNLDVFEYELNNPMALYGSVPVMWAHNSNNTAGIFWNNPSETWIDVLSSLESLSTFNKILNFVKSSEVKAKVDTHWISETGVIDLFLFMGKNPSEVMKYYGDLTGVTPLPPLFSIGYHQCRWNYNDQKDILYVDTKFDEFDMPYDVIWLDIEHTEEKKYFTWDKSKFPNPNEIVDHLDSKARKLVTVVDPHIKRVPGWNVYDSALSSDYFVKKSDGSTVYEGWCWPGSSNWPDFNHIDVRKWWANLFLSYEASRANNTYSWNDMGEPSVFSGPEVTMIKDAIHKDGWEHRDIHNLYGFQIHRATWEAQLLRSDNQERPFVLTRAFFAGSQRYGAVWTGDNTANWEHLRITTPMLLSLSVSGIHFCGADVGGFFGNPEAELQVRWYQAAAFHPFYRGHAHLDTKRREPYLLESKDMRGYVRHALYERYRLLPYWYTLFRIAEQTSQPPMAPLWVHFPRDTNTFTIEDQFMIGPAILVKPITEPSVTSTTVYLPPAIWYLQGSWESYNGLGQNNENTGSGVTITIPVSIKSIPVFYRSGTIVPRRERIRRSSYLTRYDPFTFLIFLDHNSNPTAEGQLYFDDYHTLKYQNPHNPIYNHFKLLFKDNTLSAQSLHFSKQLPLIKLERVVICGLKEKPSKVILVSKREVESEESTELEFFYMSERLLLVIRNPKLDLGAKWFIKLDYHSVEL